MTVSDMTAFRGNFIFSRAEENLVVNDDPIAYHILRMFVVLGLTDQAFPMRPQ